MTQTAAVITDGIVTNMIVMPDDYADTDPTIVALPTGSSVTFGWLWDGNKFTMTQDMIEQQYEALAAFSNGQVLRYTLMGDSTTALKWREYLTALQNMNLAAENPPLWPERPSN